MPTEQSERRIVFRPMTAALIVVAAVCLLIAVVYFTTAAESLPAFFPGHAAHVTRHHTKHGIAFIGLAVLALIGAWFTTAPTSST